MAKMSFKYQPPLGLIPTEARIIEPHREVKPPAKPSAPKPIDFDIDGKVDRWWHASSFDLRTGLDVSVDPSDTVPGDLLDELFKPRRDR